VEPSKGCTSARLGMEGQKKIHQIVDKKDKKDSMSGGGEKFQGKHADEGRKTSAE